MLLLGRGEVSHFLQPLKPYFSQNILRTRVLTL